MLDKLGLDDSLGSSHLFSPIVARGHLFGREKPPFWDRQDIDGDIAGRWGGGALAMALASIEIALSRQARSLSKAKTYFVNSSAGKWPSVAEPNEPSHFFRDTHHSVQFYGRSGVQPGALPLGHAGNHTENSRVGV